MEYLGWMGETENSWRLEEDFIWLVFDFGLRFWQFSCFWVWWSWVLESWGWVLQGDRRQLGLFRLFEDEKRVFWKVGWLPCQGFWFLRLSGCFRTSWEEKRQFISGSSNISMLLSLIMLRSSSDFSMNWDSLSSFCPSDIEEILSSKSWFFGMKQENFSRDFSYEF